MKKESPGRLRSLLAAGSLMTVGLTMALSVGIGVMGGWMLDQWLRTRWLAIAGLLLGVVAGFQQLIRAVIAANRFQDEADRLERAGRDDQKI